MCAPLLGFICSCELTNQSAAVPGHLLFKLGNTRTNKATKTTRLKVAARHGHPNTGRNIAEDHHNFVLVKVGVEGGAGDFFTLKPFQELYFTHRRTFSCTHKASRHQQRKRSLVPCL
ncbi:unnamed protein product [Ectocarpus sp. 12 AP-2014]